jgi:hypothetical protein
VAPATFAPSSAARASFSASGFSPNTASGLGGGYASAYAVRPSSDTNARSPVDVNDAMRAPGSARSSRWSTAASSCRTPRESTVLPSGSFTTGMSGALSAPPVPRYCWEMATFVSQPSSSGTENFCLSASAAGPDAAMPAMVSTIQPITTVRL